MQGCLSKKKLDHGRFEDPYKQKVYCWIKDGKFYLCPANNDKRPVSLSNKEVYDLNDWKVSGSHDSTHSYTMAESSSLHPKHALSDSCWVVAPECFFRLKWHSFQVVLEDKGKFALENNHGEQIKLKSDHPTESKAWTDQITKSLRDAVYFWLDVFQY